MDKKKSQISVLIILALMIIVLILGIFFIKEKGKSDNEGEFAEDPIYQYVASCLKQISEESILLVSENGGYFVTLEPAIKQSIPFYFYGGDDFMPSINRVENELSESIEFFLSYCINDFSKFPDYEIKDSPADIKTEIRNESVEITADYLLGISKGEESYEIENFEVEVPVRLGLVINLVSELIEKQKEDSSSICLSCFYEAGDKNNLAFNILDTNVSDEFIIVVKDYQFKLVDKNLAYNYAIKLDLSAGEGENVL